MYEDVAQVPLAEHNDMVKALPADRADQALGIAVLPRRARGRGTIPNAERADAANKDIAVATIAVTDQITAARGCARRFAIHGWVAPVASP